MAQVRNYQYEALPVPRGWNDDERQLVARLTELFDIIFSWKGRLRVNDLAKSAVETLTRSGRFTASQITDFAAAVERTLDDGWPKRKLSVAQLAGLDAAARDFLQKGRLSAERLTGLDVCVTRAVRQYMSGDLMRVYAYEYDAEHALHSLAGAGASGRALWTTALAAGESVQVNGAPVTLYRSGTAVTTLPAGHWIAFVVNGPALDLL